MRTRAKRKGHRGHRKHKSHSPKAKLAQAKKLITQAQKHC